MKMDEKPFENWTEHDSQTFGTLHADIIGPMSLEACCPHAKFSLIMHDDCLGFGFVFNLAHKDKMAKVIINLEKSIENKFQKRVHTLKTDNGGEFINHKLKSHCHSRGISLMTSVPYSPELNGQAERWNRTHVEGMRTMLRDSDLGKDLWGEALLTHIYIVTDAPQAFSLATLCCTKKFLPRHHASITFAYSVQSVSSRCLMKPSQNLMIRPKNVNLSDTKVTPSTWLWMQTRREYACVT